MPSAPVIRTDLRRFDATMYALAQASRRTDEEIISLNAFLMMRAVAWNTPKRRGYLRGGWSPAFAALNRRTPGTSFNIGQHLDKYKRVYDVDGRVQDERKAPGMKSFTAVNRTSIFNKLRRKVYYGYIHERRRGWLSRAFREADLKGQQQLARLIDKYRVR